MQTCLANRVRLTGCLLFDGQQAINELLLCLQFRLPIGDVLVVVQDMVEAERAARSGKKGKAKKAKKGKKGKKGDAKGKGKKKKDPTVWLARNSYS